MSCALPHIITVWKIEHRPNCFMVDACRSTSRSTDVLVNNVGLSVRKNEGRWGDSTTQRLIFCLLVCLFFSLVCMSVCLYVCSVCQSVLLSVCLCVCPSLCMFVLCVCPHVCACFTNNPLLSGSSSYLVCIVVHGFAESRVTSLLLEWTSHALIETEPASGTHRVIIGVRPVKASHERAQHVSVSLFAASTSHFVYELRQTKPWLSCPCFCC